ncbi:hypothetical protein ACK3BE_11420 [Pseudomonas mandelii]|jgi:ornithine decarboxylase|uniref:Orn/Lys/Arg decarboxylase C-terminal domain-containing protein n=1 Tax=Pseudomonas fluorescens TaxID=294 RepID=A0A5E7GII3_PSEFL|nr:hypothetical protein PS870_00330 [Pseudomonas fluorescens]
MPRLPAPLIREDSSFASIRPAGSSSTSLAKRCFATTQIEYIRGNVEWVPLADADGRIAAEGALPYPPGVLCVVPGEIRGGAVLKYFLALEEGINRLPGFTPELQGVYLKHEGGRTRAYGYVLKA